MRFSNLLVILIIIILLFGLLAVSGCSEKAECEKSSECATSNPCVIGRCVDGQCVNTIKDNCCGNARCEKDAGENKCTCSDDCGECAGKARFNISTYRGQEEQESEYAVYMCRNDECILGVPESDVNLLRLTSDVEERNAFKIEILASLNNPFDLSSDELSLRLQLKDMDPDVVGAITITSLQVLSDDELMGEQLMKRALDKVGDMFTQDMNLSSAQSALEKERKIEVKLDYEYVIDYRGEQTVERDSATRGLSEEIMFVKP